MAWTRTLSAAQDLDMYFRYRYTPTLVSTIDQSGFYKADILPWLGGNFGARISETTWSLYAFDYKLEFSAHYLKFLATTVRLGHSNFISNGTSLTNIFALESFHVDSDFFGAFASFGFYQRYTALENASIFPSFGTDGLVDGDYLAQIGFRVSPIKNYSITAQLANFEEIDVYNINNPFAQVTLGYKDPKGDWSASLFGRYKILLGFGQLDEFLVGVGVTLRLNNETALVN
jgi:hypothetical protein